MSPLRPLIPKAGARPLARYSPGMEVAAGARLVFVSGQIAVNAEGRTPESAEAQTELCFAAIRSVLAEAGMELSDIVRLNAYVSDRAYLADYMRVRDRHVATPPPASTLMIVSGFAQPQFKVEVECVAARA